MKIYLGLNQLQKARPLLKQRDKEIHHVAIASLIRQKRVMTRGAAVIAVDGRLVARARLVVLKRKIHLHKGLANRL